MENSLEKFAFGSGVLGLAVAALTGAGRLLGFRHMLGFESLTLLVAAIALMVASCMVQLYLIRQQGS